jgi:uncharacterized protein
MILTVYQAKKLQNALRSKNKSVNISLDLGISDTEVTIEDKSFIFPGDQRLSETDIKKIIKKDTTCFLIEKSIIYPINLFSEKTQKFYKLYPTKDWPSLEISGIRMHVTKSMSPKEDTEKKISFITPCTGRILDTCTGLGYTAIMASRTAEQVFTYEIDENVIEMQKMNPHSQELFTSEKIKRNHGDIFAEIKKLPANHFDAVIHDPPRLALSTLLYSGDFYHQLFRVMKKNSCLYHYTGDPGSKKGQDIRMGIMRRLKESRFNEVSRVFNGVVARK